jgi:hypothetical protein
VRSVVVYGEILPPDAPSFSGPLFHTDVMFTCHGFCVNSSEMSHAAAVPALAGTPLNVGRLFRTVVDNVLTLLSFENLVRRTQ